MVATDTSIQAANATRGQVANALRQSATQSGHDFGYLMRVAEQESRFQTNAKASNSTAAGVFQFNEQTWLQMVKSNGAKYGLADQAAQIKVGAHGRLEVPDPAARKAILAERHDPKLATQMASELASTNRNFLTKHLGRQATDGEVVAAHAFGGTGALKLIHARAADPNQSAAQVLPNAAHANRNLFYDHATHQPRTVGQVMARLDGIAGGQSSKPATTAGTLSGGNAVMLASLAN